MSGGGGFAGIIAAAGNSRDCQLIIKAFPTIAFNPVNCCNTNDDNIIQCNADGSIRTLNLSRQRLTGSIPEALGDLVSIQTLWLYENFFTGTIPESLGRLKSVYSLDLSSNQLTGSIPSSFGNLSSADSINLASNYLEGSLPTSLGALQELSYFGVQQNYLSGGLPDMPNLKHTIFFGTDFNCLRGDVPPSLVAHGVLSMGPQWDDCSILRKQSTDCIVATQSWPEFIYPSLNCCQSNAVNCDANGNIIKMTIADTSNSDHVYAIGLNPAFGSLKHIKSLEIDRYQTGCYSDGPFSFQLSSTIGNLKSLRELKLTGSTFVGKLPHSLGDLTELRSIDLSYNAFEGSIPDEIANLKKLKKLWLSSNSFNGNISSHVGDLVSLVDLRLDNNLFDGVVPSSLAKLNALNTLFELQQQWNAEQCATKNFNPPDCTILSQIFPTLSFSGNCCSSDLVGCDDSFSITKVSVSQQNLTGSIPNGLSGLKSLAFLDLSRNNLTGVIADWIGDLPLTYLSLAQNSLTGGLPNTNIKGNKLSGPVDVLWNLTSMESIYLGDNGFTGTISDNIGNFMGLGTFVGANNFFVGDVPAELGSDFNTIYTVDFSHNQLTGIPDSIIKSPFIRDLNLAYNQFQGLFPEGFGLNPNLKTFNIGSNNFTGPFPDFLENISYLQYLYLDNTNMEGEIPQSWTRLTGLSALHLRNNRITGPIPEFFGNMSSLEDLDLSHNFFTGQLPPSLGELKYLAKLNLQDNPNVVGSIPDSFANLSRLISLNLGNTNVSGSIPDWLGNSLTSLQEFYVYNTLISGGLPRSLANLTRLTTLGVWNNSLMGEIPPEIGNMPMLHYFYAELNLLNGTVPDSFKNLSLIDINVSGNCLKDSFPESLTSHGFKLGPQRERCSKDVLPPGINTSTASSSVPVITSGSSRESIMSLVTTTISGDFKNITDISTVFVTLPPIASIHPTEGTIPAGNNTTGASSHVAMIFVALGGVSAAVCLAVVGVFVLFLYRRSRKENEKVNMHHEFTDGIIEKDVRISKLDQVYPYHGKSESMVLEHTLSNVERLSALEDYKPRFRQESANVPVISFTPQPQQRLNIKHTKRSNESLSNPADAFINADEQPEVLTETQHHGQVDPDNLARYQLLAELQPVNVIELEQQFQRLYGPFTGWSHQLVMEWVRLRSFDSVVVEFFKNNQIDGSTMEMLSMTTLQSKFNVQDFRERARIIQALEFLRHSVKAPGNSTVNDSDSSLLPVYES
ncbi:hypothetical protein HDU76_003539 [Blyttiomyces sp. JEL0837]|nr:hypothetical protein HDU76_003539 [Blyttiomyces sp. JEL0837]